MNTTTGPCPQHPFGHQWDTDPLRCTGCGTTRTAAEAITSLVASVRGRDEKTANRLLCTFRDAVRADLLDELRHTPERKSGPICTEAEARDAGLDIAPGLGELTAMADTVVAAAEGAPTPAVDLARAVPLMAACIQRLRGALSDTADQVAERDDEIGKLSARVTEQHRVIHKAIVDMGTTPESVAGTASDELHAVFDLLRDAHRAALAAQAAP